MEVEPCGEPPAFTTHFPEWEDEISQTWMEDDPYTAARKKIAAERAALEAERKAKNQTNDDNFADPSFNKYPVE